MNTGTHEPEQQPEAKPPQAAAPALAAARSPADQALWLQRSVGNRATTQLLRRQAPGERRLGRVVEMRPPGKGEASAFERRQEFLDRINQQTPGVVYSLDGQVLEYEVLVPGMIENFDKKMMEFIDNKTVAPMRLITNEGLVDGQRLLIDSFNLAYVDLDDMLACSDVSFQLNLIHFLEERLAIKDYDKKIGTNIAGFDAAHHKGIASETEHLRTIVGDPTIEFTFEEDQGNGRVVFGFRSKPNGYRIFHIFKRGAKGVQGGDLFVLKKGAKKQITLEEFLAERAAAAEAAATAAQVERERLSGATEHRAGGVSVPAP